MAHTKTGAVCKPNILRRFARDRRGVSAVEFALVAPIMIALYFGVVEVSEGVSADRKVSLTAATLANLTAQVATISSSDMTNILDASSAVISPYDKTKLKITITCISIDSTKKATAKWSVTRNGTASSGTMTLPSALAVAGTQLVLAEVSYAYTPTVGSNITGTINLSDKMYMSPRVTAPTYGTTACT
ncbi:MAG: pilus assembly protein [Pseudolabrys sp.]|nr:pilus assembly protein [Pseudolabrys sp.]MDP2298358.1 pilus assembly protein [Pseudolabrys sp.]